MKFRTASYAENNPASGQTFERFRPVYRLNKSTNELELTDEVIDIDELVNSCKDICLQTCLERFMPTESQDDMTVLYDSMHDDLDIMTELHERADYWRDQYNLGDMPVEDVFKFIQKQLDELKNKINVASEMAKGDEKNEEQKENQ